MSEYLKREDVRRAVLHNEGDAVIAAIDELQPVEVVRCKECRHRDPEDHMCDCAGHENLLGKFLPMPDDYFCADGEKRGTA